MTWDEEPQTLRCADCFMRFTERDLKPLYQSVLSSKPPDYLNSNFTSQNMLVACPLLPRLDSLFVNLLFYSINAS